LFTGKAIRQCVSARVIRIVNFFVQSVVNFTIEKAVHK